MMAHGYRRGFTAPVGPPEPWQSRFDRLHARWRTLAKRARRWCNALEHSMGPLHQSSPYDTVSSTRQMTCRYCNFTLWVRPNGEVQGLPSYKICRRVR